MKAMKLFFMVVLTVFVSGSLIAQGTAKQKTETLKVWGNCSMCKDRIEKTAKSEGASAAAWDSKTKMLTVSFDPSKTNADAISKKIALSGHDTEKFKADDKTYSALPGCCHYERKKQD